eukprot:gene7723-biopygen4838
MLCCSPRVSPVVAPAENGEEMTQSLLLVAEGNENSPRHVRHLVRYGADITRAPALHGALPAFLMFAASGRLDCFAACLTTPAPIDFTRGYLQWSITGNSGEEIVFRPSVLFVLCLAKGKEEASIIFNAIAKRLKKNVPGDAVEWEKGFGPLGRTTSCRTWQIINCCMLYGRLSRAWTTLRRRRTPYPSTAPRQKAIGSS